MRKPSIFQRRRRELKIEMTAMIDVVFLLLIFFVYAASDAKIELLLPSSVSVSQGTTASPSVEPPPEADFDNIVVRILRQNGTVHWELNDAPLASLVELQSQLSAIGEIKRDAPVILHPDPQVPLGDVVDVYDIARVIGFEEVKFAASAP